VAKLFGYWTYFEMVSHLSGGNSCADKIANPGNAYEGWEWWYLLPHLLRDDFLRDKLRIPQYRTT
jgi:hypothetical protein